MECVKDCWKCELEGCPLTLVESQYLEMEASEKLAETPRQLAVRKYNRSQKGKENQRRWKKSEKGRAYIREDKKKFYQKNREKILEKKKIYYQQNAEKIKAKRMEYYHKKKELKNA